ncbi:MAG TPA: anthranilate synthase component I family protein [Bacteroidales bacterium]|nr:anthranilate synthase component I family protein [Bacteroidales bacterium]
MADFIISTTSRKLLADIITPVSIYLRIRDIYPNSLLLESSDYQGNENSYSFICMKPMAGFEADNGIVTETYPDGSKISTEIKDSNTFNSRFSAFTKAFSQKGEGAEIPVNGLFGYISYDAVEYFETIDLNPERDYPHKIPDIRYHLYKYIIAINHFQNTLNIIENKINGETGEMDRIETILNSRNLAIYSFKTVGEENRNITDDQFRKMVSKGKEHCYLGDVFQVVMSRQFSRQFTGDEFNVYRALRSINPSPYLFYFDYGNYKIFGSSPEAHLKINKGKAYINPIAGTFKRTGDDESDKLLAEQLSTDLKENAEHVMLVDLARNDLSRHARNVRVESYREVQFYSHVIHLVSAVSGELKEGTSMAEMMAATFPAGTLSGAPKYMAMKIIDKYENQRRGYYGGAIGFLDFRGRFNHAIMIRTFLSKGNNLYYQAGAGIVAVSNEENELQEVNNKLGALRKAIEMAGDIK